MKKAWRSLVAVMLILSVGPPLLESTALADPDDFAGGSGSADDPYQITDWNHLDNVRYNLSSHFILMNDLDADTDGYDDLAGSGANGGEGWDPIGGSFTGTFDGQGYEICDLVINRPSKDNVGLFGLTTNAFIDAVGMVNVQVSGRDKVSALVGENVGAISNCYIIGSVDGSSTVGGLIGVNWGSASNCCATGSVDGSSTVGGLIGGNYLWESYCGIVSNCYATSSVHGGGSVGGLIGGNSGTVGKCYATGSVSGVDRVGGLVGYSTNGTVTDCFWDTQTSGMATSDGGTGKTTAELMRLETFTDTDTPGLDEAWDMAAVGHGEIDATAIWNIVDGRSYPYFGWLRMRFELKAGWNMVSVPRELPAGKDTVAEVFKGEIVAIYTWDPMAKSYVVPVTLEPSCGYWVAVTEDKTIAYLMKA